MLGVRSAKPNRRAPERSAEELVTLIQGCSCEQGEARQFGRSEAVRVRPWFLNNAMADDQSWIRAGKQVLILKINLRRLLGLCLRALRLLSLGEREAFL